MISNAVRHAAYPLPYDMPHILRRLAFCTRACAAVRNAHAPYMSMRQLCVYIYIYIYVDYMYNLTYIISVVYVTAHIILHSNSSTCRCGVCCAMACTAAAPPCQGYDERTCRTVAIETAMKSSAFGQRPKRTIPPSPDTGKPERWKP